MTNVTDDGIDFFAAAAPIAVCSAAESKRAESMSRNDGSVFHAINAASSSALFTLLSKTKQIVSAEAQDRTSRFDGRMQQINPNDWLRPVPSHEEQKSTSAANRFERSAHQIARRIPLMSTQ
jgi:hypothetical protein